MKALFAFIITCFLLNVFYISGHESRANQIEGVTSFNGNQPIDKFVYQHIIDFVSDDGSQLHLKDGLTFKINWWYRSFAKKWKKGDPLYITYDFSYKQFKMEHPALTGEAWGDIAAVPPLSILNIRSIRKPSNRSETYTKITLSNDYISKSVSGHDFSNWQVKDRIIVFVNPGDVYQLFNLDQTDIRLCQLIGNSKVKETEHIAIQDVLNIEDRLNQQVLQQPGATQAIATALLNYVAGFKGKGRPIAVFLFLGPTGVGKTELAKVLTEEIYHDSSKMLRFDMSHFNEHYSITRLIGSPPGYINHDEGGQLTEPLIENSRQVVLLDELEKAHPEILKAFLPIFDEGYILDSKNIRVDCSDAIFILTSNLCGPQIAELYKKGFQEEEILAVIEPTLIKTLSPEFYNRVEPVLFRPLAKETMHALVDLMLKQLKDKVLLEREMTLLIDDSIKDFLVDKGYHPFLGARPLKKLVEKRIVAELALYIIRNNPPTGAVLSLFYDQETDSVIIE